MSENETKTKLLTVGELRHLIEEADLDDDALVIVMASRDEREYDEDDGERYAETASASKGYGEASYVRIFLPGSQ